MRTKLFIAVVCVLIILFVGQCAVGSYWAVPRIKQNAVKMYESNQFDVVGYQGYQARWPEGGIVWYTLKKGNITYQSGCKYWLGEYHLYNLSAVDAIKP